MVRRSENAPVAWLTGALAPYSVTNHTVSNIEIIFDSRDRAQRPSYVQAWHAFGDGRPDVLAYGRYYDIWVRNALRLAGEGASFQGGRRRRARPRPARPSRLARPRQVPRGEDARGSRYVEPRSARRSMIT
jgi:hypothetical protein